MWLTNPTKIMNKETKKQYASPRARIAPFALEKFFLTVSASVPGATIGDSEEEDWGSVS